ncbi:uncharacterized protein PAC_16794 [Phialocephala subalpina]|uniref:Major facilitator superfamily (MFS) profile domain-containing protein n=1 Tax=Phialocephala subalpina TaxID=576137 RepID=A0A1L7XPD6_9HELO|nr:uncharacterized protein PAC_16794 [Phialocephala subalpina]
MTASRKPDTENIGRTQDHGYARLWWQLLILGSVRFSEALAWTSVFPYAFFMMQSMLPEVPNRDGQAATYASLAIGLFTFGEFLSGVARAKVSDRIGRKLTLIIGVIGTSSSALAFGFSTNVWMALGIRLFGGLVNPNVGVVSTCVGELVQKKEHQGKGFSVVPFLRGLGGLTGPLIGGHLANLVKNLLSAFREGTLWEIFLYLLPNLTVALSIISSGLLAFLFLKESHPQMQGRADLGRNLTSWIWGKFRDLFDKVDNRRYAKLDTEEDSIPLPTIEHVNDEDSVKKESEEFEIPECHQTLSDPARPKLSAYTSKVILQILAVSLLAFHKVSSDVIIPTFLATPFDENYSSLDTRGLFKFAVGFGMELPSIGNVLLSQAITVIISQMLIVPRAIDHFGPLKTFRWAVFAFPWLYCLTPFTATLPYPLSLAVLLLDLWIKAALVSLGYTSSAILLTNTSPTPEHLATVNGAAGAFGGLARSIGAAASGSLFNFGLTTGYIVLPFRTLGTIAAAGAVLVWFLDDKP